MSRKLSFKVNIMDRDFTVACEDGDQENLLAAAAHLDRQMRAIQKSGKVIGHERCAIMAALNIANELLTGTEVQSENPEVMRRVDDMIDRLEETLDA